MLTHEEELREWARGSYPLVAATELLLRGFGGKFARPGEPWIVCGDGNGHWVDFESIPDFIGALSGGERRFLLIAASLGAGVPVVLGDLLSGLDRANVELVLAAVAHAAGSHEHSELVVLPTGQGRFDKLPTLYPWPEK